MIFPFPFISGPSREVACQVARTHLPGLCALCLAVAGSDLMDGKRGPRTIGPCIVGGPEAPSMIRAPCNNKYVPTISAGQLQLVAPTERFGICHCLVPTEHRAWLILLRDPSIHAARCGEETALEVAVVNPTLNQCRGLSAKSIGHFQQ